MVEARAEPWKLGFLSYAGWVPNVRSHLSFSRIGAARRAATFTMPVPVGRTRVVLVQLSRDSNDYPVWAWLARWRHPDIRLNWYLDAETAATELPVVIGEDIRVERDRQGMLTGRISLLGRQPTAAAEAVAKDELKRLRTALNIPRTLDTAAAIGDLRRRCTGMIRDAGFSITLNFALMRTGEGRIWYDAAVPGFAPKQHDWVAQQAYYFLKDVAHDHTHHDPSDDQITPLVRFDPASVEEGHEDEIAWRRETMWSLSREIERRNREGSLVEQRQALGIIAYAEAFQASLMSHVRDATAPQGFRLSDAIHHFDFRFLKDSVKASIDVLGTRLGQRIQLAIAFMATLISSMALVSSLVSAFNSGRARDAHGGPKDGFKVDVGDWFVVAAHHPYSAGIGIAFLLVLAILLFVANPPASLFNRCQRLFSQFGRALSVTAFRGKPLRQWLFDLAYHLVGLMVALTLTGASLALIAGGGNWWL